MCVVNVVGTKSLCILKIFIINVFWLNSFDFIHVVLGVVVSSELLEKLSYI